MGLDSGLTVCQCLTSQCKHRLFQEVSPGASNVGSCLSSEHRRFQIRVSVYGVVLVPRGHNPSNQTVGCPRTRARRPPHLVTTKAHLSRLTGCVSGDKAMQGRLGQERGQVGGQGTELWEVWL